MSATCSYWVQQLETIEKTPFFCWKFPDHAGGRSDHVGRPLPGGCCPLMNRVAIWGDQCSKCRAVGNVRALGVLADNAWTLNAWLKEQLVVVHPGVQVTDNHLHEPGPLVITLAWVEEFFPAVKIKSLRDLCSDRGREIFSPKPSMRRKVREGGPTFVV